MRSGSAKVNFVCLVGFAFSKSVQYAEMMKVTGSVPRSSMRDAGRILASPRSSPRTPVITMFYVEKLSLRSMVPWAIPSTNSPGVVFRSVNRMESPLVVPVPTNEASTAPDAIADWRVAGVVGALGSTFPPWANSPIAVANAAASSPSVRGIGTSLSCLFSLFTSMLGISVVRM
jgi:hypothetical protein